MIRIDSSRCVRCGLCAGVCAAHCFHVDENAVHIRHEEYCMHCGHCAAVCPRAAVTLDDVAPDTLAPMTAFPTAESLSALIRGRRSLRVFKEDAVPRETLREALDTVRYAPTGKNLENVSWLVLEGRPTLRRVADRVVDVFRNHEQMRGLVLSHDSGNDPVFRGAPCAVFACAEGSYDLDIVNCSIAVATLDLLLPTMGLGGCWAGFVMRAAAMNDSVREAMGLAAPLKPLAGLMVGLPALHYRRIPQRRELRVQWVNGETA
ncbi:nitroreductase family protein [Mailhella massiliensis]|uniref:nitroreductase family protein n=1 Tax=Mailhella massiliensis TaxID=1903261 RepID=UPI002352C6A5|nr:nitroreductase family protein [Mailhella massiliensis]